MEQQIQNEENGKRPIESLSVMTELLLPSHANLLGTAFGGQILSWMDICAGLAAKKHCKRPCVTAAVNTVHFINPIHVGETAIMKSKVVCAFKTSMEVVVTMYAESLSGERRLCCSSGFTFVSLDKNGNKTTEAIPKLIPQSEQEKLMNIEANQRRSLLMKERNEKKNHDYAQKAQEDSTSTLTTSVNQMLTLSSSPYLVQSDLKPSEKSQSESQQDTEKKDSQHIHHHHHHHNGDDWAYTSLSSVEATHLVLPSHANSLGITFGGQIMNWMESCANIAAMRHSKKICVLASLDRLHFVQPTFVGDAIIFKSQVNRTFKSSMEVGVTVWAENLITGEKRYCNRSYFTYVTVDILSQNINTQLPFRGPQQQILQKLQEKHQKQIEDSSSLSDKESQKYLRRIIPQTEDEKRRYFQAEQRRNQRLKERDNLNQRVVDD